MDFKWKTKGLTRSLSTGDKNHEVMNKKIGKEGGRVKTWEQECPKNGIKNKSSKLAHTFCKRVLKNSASLDVADMYYGLICITYFNVDIMLHEVRYQQYWRSATKHTMKEYRKWRYCSKHSLPCKEMKNSCQPHVPAALPRGQSPRFPLNRWLGKGWGVPQLLSKFRRR